MRTRSYTYINKLGVRKQLVIDMEPVKGGKYHVTMWDLDHGNYTGSGYMTVEEIDNFLAAYNINESFSALIESYMPIYGE